MTAMTSKRSRPHCSLRDRRRRETLDAMSPSGDPPIALVEGGGYPPEFVAVVTRALEPEPSRRYQSAAEFAAALTPFA